MEHIFSQKKYEPIKMILKIMKMMRSSFVSFAAVTSRQNKVAASTKRIATKHIDLK